MTVLKLIILVALVALIQSTPVKVSPRAEEYRLPTNVAPSHYLLDITLTEDTFETNIFSGTLYLTFTTLAATSEIKIHANEKLKISEVTLRTVNGVPIALTNTNFVPDSATEILTITPSQELAADVGYILFFAYTAELREDEMYGFYKSDYVDASGNKQFLATTQFQPTYARRAFPCFDEPSFKAAFDIRITHPNKYNAKANTPFTTYERDENNTLTVFKATPIMPTYLIAFIVSDFTCDEGVAIDESNPYTVCSREEAASTRALAIEKGPPIMHALEAFTGIDYNTSTIGKMEQFAIPDFAAGAMENWGLVTYRETALLWDPEESSNRYKQRIETVIAHEFAHMWFGNLITTHWWSDTFLNEGFATFFEYFSTGAVETSWEMETQFVLEAHQPALISDASSTSSALSSPASTPAEVSSRFSTISYSKGGSVFRMVEHFMGSENFQNGINAYLEAHKFSNTNPEDLWSALNPFSSNLPATLSVVINAWTYKPGFPLLQVSVNGQGITISQERFLASGTPNAADKWYVPISYSTSADSNKFQDTSAKAWLLPTTNLVIPNVLSTDSWIILNNRESAFYRINYDDTLWERIRLALTKTHFDGIHELNRAQIVDDFYNLARSGKQSYEKFFSLLEFLKKDSAYGPWYSAFTAFNDIFIRTGNEELRKAISIYILDLMEVLLNSVPFDITKEDNQIYTHNRVQAHTWACRLGFDHCIENSITAFSALKNNNIKVDKNLRPVVYCNGLRHSNSIQADWDFLWEKYLGTKLATEQIVILAALGCATDATVLNNYLTKSITENSGIRPQDALSVFSSVYTSSPENLDIAFDFLLNNHQQITNYYTSMNSLNNLVTGLANRFTKQEQLDKLTAFLSDTTDLPESLIIAGETAVAMAKTNLEFIEEFEKELTLLFIPQVSEEPPTEAVPSPPTDADDSTPDSESSTPGGTTPGGSTPGGNTSGESAVNVHVSKISFFITVLLVIKQFFQ